MTNIRIAYIVSKFPFLRETFMLREIEELKKRGIFAKVCSLKNLTNEELKLDEVKKFLPDSLHAPYFLSYSLILSNLKTFLRNPIKYLYWLLWLGLKLNKVPSRLVKTIATFPKIVHFAKIMADDRISHIHAHWANIPTTAALIIADLNNITFSFTGRAFDLYETVNQPLLKEKTLRATHMVTICEFNKKLLFNLTGLNSNIEIIYNSIKLSNYRFKVYEDRKDFVVAAGTLEKRKGFDNLIKCFAHIKQIMGRELPLYILGDGPERKNIEDEISAAGLKEIKILGWQSHGEVMEWLSESRLLVVPSRIEGLPKVIIEAYATGCPVVSFAINGIPEVVMPDLTGWLVPQNDIKKLGETICEAWESKETCAQYALAGRKLVEEKFDVDKSLDKFFGLINKYKLASNV